MLQVRFAGQPAGIPGGEFTVEKLVAAFAKSQPG
jgi:hypothetical protein